MVPLRWRWKLNTNESYADADTNSSPSYYHHRANTVPADRLPYKWFASSLTARLRLLHSDTMAESYTHAHSHSHSHPYAHANRPTDFLPADRLPSGWPASFFAARN